MLSFITFQNQENLIEGVKLRQLKVNRDPRGLLVENLKETWDDVYQLPNLRFGQNYCSVTLPGYARDEDSFHNHPTKQVDRFAVIKGSAVFALFDPRENSPTKNTLNLFQMGEINGDDNQYLLLIPKQVYHCFCNIGKEPIYLLGFPTEPYDPKEEGRIQFATTPAVFSNGTPFSWKPIREYFNK